ncbi:hypothetical protein CUP0753 [Campylobacter upsaliensis RM3195]|nr:hypothetical protein CUP0753 [Campylobacter upsaliensis RM3195]
MSLENFLISEIILRKIDVIDCDFMSLYGFFCFDFLYTNTLFGERKREKGGNFKPRGV